MTDDPRAGHERQEQRAAPGEHRAEAVRQLAYAVAHELGNALSALDGFAYLLRERTLQDKQATEDLEEIRKIAGTAAFLSRELMALGSAGPPDPTRQSFGDMLVHLQRVLRYVVPASTKLVVRPAAQDVQIWADAAQLVEIVILAAAHARTTMPSGGTLQIEAGIIEMDEASGVASVDPGTYARVSVEYQPDHRSTWSQITGNVAEAAAHALRRRGGALVFGDTREPRTVSIYLPVAEPSSLPTAMPGTFDAHGAEAILLVEPDGKVAAITVTVLRQHGYAVLQAANAADAIAAASASEQHVDLVLIDRVVPGGESIDLTRRIQARHPRVRVVLMTADPAWPAAQDIAGIDPVVIPKPFTPESLVRIVREALDATRSSHPR